MRILVIGENYNLLECREKFGDGHSCLHAKDHTDASSYFGQSDVVFDFAADRSTSRGYDQITIPVFINTAKIDLKSLVASNPGGPRFGFAGLPTFLNREVLEVSILTPESHPILKALCGQLGTDFQIVDDRVGLVTPRVICMIINEAYYTVEESTATREDIDLAMKLGTNYPFGPFEWCSKIGVRNVYELLDAVYKNTRNERYVICPMLRREYLDVGNQA